MSIDHQEAAGVVPRRFSEVVMLGFIIGTVCLVGLVRVLRRGPAFAGVCGYGSSYRPRGPMGGSRWLLRWLFERLETSPGQEKAVALAVDQLRGNRTLVREEMRQTRSDLARVLAGGLVDDRSLEETFARHDRLLAQLRVAFVESLKGVTEALDEGQRKQLAEMLERGSWRGPRWGSRDRSGGMWA